MAIVSPTGFVRAAVKAQLSNAVTGLNPNLVTYAAKYGIPAWSFDFTGASRNFFEANVDYSQSERTDIPQLNLLTLYGPKATPFRDGDGRRVLNVSFSGMVDITAEMFIGVLGQSIANFEYYADAASAAMLATMNSVSNQNGLNAADSATRSGKVYDLQLDYTADKCQLDGENWIIPLRFSMGFGVIIP